MGKWEKRRSNKPLERKGDHRSCFERDLARLIHSAAFRRLQAKTQVLGIGEGDFHRTRLTHSMEVAQIGKGLVKNLVKSGDSSRIDPEVKKHLPDEDLIFCIGLAHDLGHPPFGHGGEIALNFSMRKYGGFEGNGQTLRILSKLESHTPKFGLDFTRRTLLGILKYPVYYSSLLKRDTKNKKFNNGLLKSQDWKPPKCYHDSEIDVVEWILEPFSEDDKIRFTKFQEPDNCTHGYPLYKALDTSIMELADDIAYGVHDLEDGIVLNLITKDMWMSVEEKINKDWARKNEIENMSQLLFEGSSNRKRGIGALVHAFMINTKIEKDDKFSNNLLKYKLKLLPEAEKVLKILKKCVFENIVNIPEVQTLEFRGQYIVLKIFEAIASDPKRFLKRKFLKYWEKAEDDAAKFRVICDYVSGMTDEYATRLYERLYLPRHGTVFQRL